MLSETWRLKRSQRMIIDKRQCRTCTSTENLEVHHRHYNKPLGTESVEDDLIVLCAKCHSAIHKNGGMKKKNNNVLKKQSINNEYRI